MTNDRPTVGVQGEIIHSMEQGIVHGVTDMQSANEEHPNTAVKYRTRARRVSYDHLVAVRSIDFGTKTCFIIEIVQTWNKNMLGTSRALCNSRLGAMLVGAAQDTCQR